MNQSPVTPVIKIKGCSRSRAARGNRKHPSTQPLPIPDSNGIVHIHVAKHSLPGGCVLHLPPSWAWDWERLVEQRLAAEYEDNGGSGAA